ncbi:sialate O-acetylesterase [Psychrosphaera sp. B3R10]|uniref:sialate O-acetylesterase n=1 Tax=unclassified Psychrosphaera TaxID=2641570 RepID=UPI001C086E5D|nr:MULTISPECIES: sialate O-acetylesterase [unclassified Psychrosphaera]MBU2882051.1 sialate O-acetylesterase [Psychrosphaera sp. I2R16]MBU2990449.1 sialate O-acetylesterase [Psychrosphaera sp. B3R10]
MKRHLLFWTLILFSSTALSKITVPHIFADRMVLQQKQHNPIWGKATPGAKVHVSIANQNYKVKADSKGDWRVKLAPLPAGGPYKLSIEGDYTVLEISDVLVGEVWLCSGQSNMEWRVQHINHSEIELASANFPDIRLLSVPRVGIDKPQFDVETQWYKTTPQNVRDFSAICYLYGRRLHQTLNVPIGLIKNSWGGTPIEAWIPRDALEKNNEYEELLAHWDKVAENFDEDKFNKDLAEFQDWVKAGKPKGKKLKNPANVLTGGKRPANIFNGVVNPFIGYGIRGVIWYQGEANGARGYQYRSLFPLLINSWRERWGQGDFPFYWAQLADFRPEKDTPSKYSDWAELREAQTMTLSLPNTGEAVIYDVGEARNIHPGNKQDVANRLVRHPLAKIYGYPMMADSPMYKSSRIKGNKFLLTFKNVKRKLYALDKNEVLGFYIAGKDQRFVRATAKITGKNTVEVYSNEINEPVAVRYAWEDNPVVNLYDKIGLPVTPFRTDDWPLKSRNVKK